jgi:putative DNA primase/helicase
MSRGWQMLDTTTRTNALIDQRRADDEAAAKRSADDGVVLVNGSDLTPEPIRWLWPDWLALGKLHILAGAPGQGKTTIAIAMAATVTVGGRWPDGSRCDPGNVLIWSGEDDPADTLLPRLVAAGADRSRCYFVQGTRINGDLESFDPARDMAALEWQAHQIGGVKLLIVDPVVSAVAGDSHKNTEVRRALQPLVDLASRLDAAALGISHFSKGGAGTDPASRVVGSIAFTAVARVVLVAAKVKPEDGDDNNDRRILARGKSNIGPDAGGFEYHIDQIEALPGIRASRVTWGKAVEGTARELLTDPDDLADDSTGDTTDLLRAELTPDGWTDADAACQPLKDAGFTKKQIWTASKKLRVIRRKSGMKSGWIWRLPGQWQVSDTADEAEDSAEGSEGSNIRNVESWNLRMEPSVIPAADESEVL